MYIIIRNNKIKIWCATIPLTLSTNKTMHEDVNKNQVGSSNSSEKHKVKSLLLKELHKPLCPPALNHTHIPSIKFKIDFQLSYLDFYNHIYKWGLSIVPFLCAIPNTFLIWFVCIRVCLKLVFTYCQLPPFEICCLFFNNLWCNFYRNPMESIFPK